MDFDFELLPHEAFGLFTWKPNIVLNSDFCAVEWNWVAGNLRAGFEILKFFFYLIQIITPMFSANSFGFRTQPTGTGQRGYFVLQQNRRNDRRAQIRRK